MQKILIIEDDPQLQQVYQESLTLEGFQIIQSFTAEEGLMQASAQKPDLILLDIMLPNGKNGFDVLEQLKKNENLAKIPVIVMTNLDTEKNTAISIGAVDYVVKANTSIEDIIKKVRSYLPAVKPS